MADMLNAAAAWLASQAKAHVASAVVYYRGTGSVAASATIGQTEFAQDDGQFGIRTFHSKDFIFLATDLVISGSQITPTAGDRITEVVGGKTLTHEVTSHAGNPVYRYSDPYRTRIRVHTKQVDSV